MKTDSILRIITLSLFFAALPAMAAEMRTWTDQKGRTLEGSLVKIDDDEAVIQLKAGGQVRVKRSILSARDNQYLSEYGGADSAIVDGAKVGTPEKSIKIDSKQFKELDHIFIFPDTEYDFEILESDHFLTMTHGRIRPKDIAETAERLWNGMAFQHPGFAEKWGDNKRAIFIIEDDDVHKAVGDWYMDYLSKQGDQGNEQAMKLAITWPKAAGSTIQLPDDPAQALAEDAVKELGLSSDTYGTSGKDLYRNARVFRVTKDNESTYKKVFTPFVTHCIAGDMISAQAGGTSSFGGAGYFSLITGHSYYKEIQLAGRSGTSLIDAQYDSSEIESARGFADGTGWAKELKKLVRRDKVKPSIKDVYSYKIIGLKPEQLVLLYSLSYYMQSTPQRLAAYTKMIERIDTSKQVPEPIEIAKLFGFETPEEFEADWKEFIESTSFK